MALVILNDDSNNSDSLPWVNEYLENGGEPDTASRVVSIKKTAKGFIIITREFKGFAFDGSKLFKDLQEAMPIWKQQKSLPFALFGIALKNQKIAVGTDTDFECSVTFDKKGNCDFKYSDTVSQSIQDDSNPFLMGMNTPPTTGTSAIVDLKPGSSKRKPPF